MNRKLHIQARNAARKLKRRRLCTHNLVHHAGQSRSDQTNKVKLFS